MAEIKVGVETSEKKVADRANIWGSIATVLGIIISVGGSFAPTLTGGSNLAIIAGAIIAAAGLAQKTLVSLGYIKSRADVKVADSYRSFEG